VVALADGLMASAAYWIGSAAERIYITDDITHVGSIGVVTSHTDISGAEAKAGRKTTEIYAGTTCLKNVHNQTSMSR
jgi:ClpP class serine protease